MSEGKKSIEKDTYIHVGYEIQWTEEDKKALSKYNTPLAVKPYVAVLFAPTTSRSYIVQKQSEDLKMWFQTHRGKLKIMFIKKLYRDDKKKLLVGEGHVDKEIFYIILSFNSQWKPIEIKRWVTQGLMECFELDPKLKLQCLPYAYQKQNQFIF